MDENKEVNSTDPKREKVRVIPLSAIDDAPDHPFGVRDDEEMAELVESISTFGVINPVIVRKGEGERYELISGHRRKYACAKLGIDTLPVIVRDLSREEAIIFMVDSNLQREHILPSERAKAYKMKMEALKRVPGKRYDENGAPLRLDAIVISSQHAESVSEETLRADIKKYVIDEVIPAYLIDDETKFYINPTGRFVIGGPNGDSGLTGRKIIVDTYGGYARHGGGAFSGKDCTKVDRSAARYLAKNIVAAGLADKCEIQLSYAIGVAEPTSIMVDTFGTGKIDDDKIVAMIRENVDITPMGIIETLDLRRPIYKQTAAYGHFGRHDLDLPWEKTNLADTFKKYL